MIALDTNVLLRLLVQDTPAQTALAKRLLATAEEAGEPVLINDLVLAETTWTLASHYNATKDELLEMLRVLLDTASFVFDDRAVLQQAVDRYGSSAADFAEALIVAKNLARGAHSTLTFDRAMRTLPGAQWLKA